MAKVVD